jgi:hypothetical protein
MGPPGRAATMRSRGKIEMHNAADSTIATISRSHNNYFLNRRTYTGPLRSAAQAGPEGIPEN